jgi:hypothetical protein
MVNQLYYGDNLEVLKSAEKQKEVKASQIELDI